VGIQTRPVTFPACARAMWPLKRADAGVTRARARRNTTAAPAP
jgi:hypothetical protein